MEVLGGYCRVPTKGRRGARHLPVGVNLQSILASGLLLVQRVGEKPLNNAQMLPPFCVLCPFLTCLLCC